MSDLSDVTILITSFLRPGCLAECLRGLHANLPECSIIVVDDGDVPLDIPDHSEFGGRNIILTMPFDSGLPAKRNAGVRAARTKYTLLGCDDFDFSTAEARKGIELMKAILEGHADIAVASGRVDGRAYEGFLELIPGEYVQEHPLDTDEMNDGDFKLCDLTVNYFLGHRDKILTVPWDERMKIGGEHFLWFWQMRQKGYQIAFVKGVNIKTQPYDSTKQDARYPAFRARAHSLGHRIMMQTMNIKEYRGF